MHRLPLGLAALVLASTSALAQGTRADFTRADSLAARVRGTIINAVNQARHGKAQDSEAPKVAEKEGERVVNG